MVVQGLIPAIPLLIVLGFASTATASTLNAVLQLYLPGWARARALAVPHDLHDRTGRRGTVWGQIAQHVSLSASVWIASALVAPGGVAGFFWHFPESEKLDRTPLAYWSEAQILE